MLLPLHLSFHEIDPIPHSREVYILLFSLFFVFAAAADGVNVAASPCYSRPSFCELGTDRKDEKKRKRKIYLNANPSDEN